MPQNKLQTVSPTTRTPVDPLALMDRDGMCKCTLEHFFTLHKPRLPQGVTEKVAFATFCCDLQVATKPPLGFSRFYRSLTSISTQST
jgi:hypothetical protein